MKSFDRSLLSIFASEQNEHVTRLRAVIGALTGTQIENAGSHIDELLRRLHTLKGAARAVGLEPTELLTHSLEELLLRRREAAGGFDQDLGHTLYGALDAIEDTLTAALADRDLPDITDVLASVHGSSGKASPDVHVTPPLSGKAAAAADRESEPPVSAPIPAADFIRINAGHLDNLIRASSELVVATTLDVSGHDFKEYARHLDRTAEEWLRLRRSCAGYIRGKRQDPEFQPVAECLSYMDGQLASLRRQARISADSRQTTALALQRRANDLQRNAFRVRMTPAESVFAGFGSMVRDLAHQEGKQIEFRAEGLEWQADRLVLQALRDPVMHLLRNAISHGIELPAEREAAGKSTAGLIRLRVHVRADRLLVIVEDDGRGINRTAVAEEAARKGVFEGALPTDPSELARLIFTPGFSTAKVITKISGRGMGLSVVQQAVSRLQGEIGIQPGPAAGTLVSLSAPLSLSTQHVLLVEVAGHTFGFPSSLIDRLVRATRESIRHIDGRECIVVDSRPVRLARLSTLLDLRVQGEGAPDESDDGNLRIAVVASADELAGVIVDRVLDEREAVVRETGLPGSLTGLTAGAIPLDDGSIAVMLNVTELLVRFREKAPETSAFSPEKTEERVQSILVVDDSITTRSLEKSILEAYGYRVQVAVDGIEALEKLRSNPADLVISDVMMPRMTGFELLEQMKNSPGLQEIPVVLVTSLESREEQEQGLALGADAYIVKRKFDQRELLNIVRQIL